MKIKLRNLLTVSFLAIAGIFTASAVIVNNKAEETTIKEKADAATYDLPTSNGDFLFLAYWNDDWMKYDYGKTDAKIWAHFYGDNGTNDVGPLNQDKYIYYNAGSNNIYYFCNPTDRSKQYHHVIFVKTKQGATSLVWSGDNYLAQTTGVELKSSMNWAAPYGYAGGNVNTGLEPNVSNTWTKAGGETIYIREYDGDNTTPPWTTTDGTDEYTVQVHVWGNTRTYDEFYLTTKPYKVEGYYDDAMTNQVVHLYEVTLPTTGRWRWFQVKRLKNGIAEAQTKNNMNFDSTKDVWQYDNSTGWYDGYMSGAWSWNINTVGGSRAAVYSRYIVKQTESRCTSAYYDINTASDFADAWSNIKSQYENMSSTNQGVFWAAAETEASYPGKGALRYDYLVKKYGLEDFAERKNPGGGYNLGTITGFKPYYFLNSNEDAVIDVVLIFSSTVSILSIVVLGVLILKKKKRQTN